LPPQVAHIAIRASQVVHEVQLLHRPCAANRLALLAVLANTVGGRAPERCHACPDYIRIESIQSLADGNGALPSLMT